MFVKLDPGFFLFFICTIVGSLIGVFASSPIGLWFAMEVNFFGAVSLFSGKSSVETDSTMKYFMSQALGSGLLFLGILLSLGSFIEVSSGVMSVLGGVFLLMGFNMKIGLFPFHFWVPSVMSGCSWVNCFVLSSWQKILPLWLVSGVGFGSLSFLLIACCVFTALVGGVGGLGQVYFRPLIGYSSLVHSGWMVLLAVTSVFSLGVYLLVYSFVLAGLLYSLSLSHSYCFQHVPGLFFGGSGNSFWIWIGLYFLSLGGLPPFFGSVLKILGVFNLSSVMPLALMVLILSSLISLFYYLNIFFNFSLSLSGMKSYYAVEKFSYGKFSNFLALSSISINIGMSVIFILLGYWFWF
uniref:NADH-ubiquinone oxidoreductase chain 2 n=1 Tax=Sinonovacula constricta TaxID=98310 RepID=B5AYF0_SINCO|nr:NADH dehydrogenase subunit 2 [Sinonovacula constricta]ACF41617.1 NADH dehydrogenase subunit 2 [Sinonovacula constricta]AEV94322.1 NADH dehydrogenase subunit 2 [Sinonovacula constricta]